MSTTAPTPVTTPIPVQLSEPEFTAFILPHLSMPRRGPKCKLGYYRVFNLILWVLYTSMQWKSLPIPPDPQDKPAIHYTTIYKVFAKWANDSSLWQAFVASVRHLAEAKQLDLCILHGAGPTLMPCTRQRGRPSRQLPRQAPWDKKILFSNKNGVL